MRLNQQNYSGWGRVLRAEAGIARPERHGHLADVVAGAESILAHGGLRSYGDTALAAGDLALSTARLDRFLSFDQDAGVLEAEAGVRLGEILRLFAPRGWMPATLPGTGQTTLAGAIANDVHGKNHHVVGSFGQHVDTVAMIDATGKPRRIGPRKDATLFKATVGGLGQTGLITSAKIKLAPCPSEVMVVDEARMDDLEDFLDRFDSETAPFQVGWIDTLARGKWLGRGIFEAADFGAAGAMPGKVKKAKSLPMALPGFALSSPIVKAFNAAYRARVPSGGRVVERALAQFFFPLDAVTNWNLAYGKRGFHQFQAVVPLHGAPDNLRKMLEVVATGKLASPLAVIKKTGAGRAGFLSFPMEGYSLALDIPNAKGAGAVLAQLEALTLDAGGRVYLAKDSAATPDAIAAMYPELTQYQAAVAKADPDGKFLSAMAQRLNLRGTS